MANNTSKSELKIHGFVSVGRGQGTYMGWTVAIIHQTEKAVKLACLETQQTMWLPKSCATQDSDGSRALNAFGVRLVREAGFRATDFYGDVI